MTPSARLRQLIDTPGATLLAGCHDGLTARLVAEAGFAAAHMSGFALSASLLGQPDRGLLTMIEMAGAVGRISTVLGGIPLLADADTGFGNDLNTARTVDAYIRAGAAGLHIEDQVFPKRCGYQGGTEVVPVDEMCAKLRAGRRVADRLDPDFVIVGRTDARATEGFDAAIERALRYRDAGADVLFVEALTSVDEVAEVADRLGDHPLLHNNSEARFPSHSIVDLTALGFTLVLAPITGLLAGARAMRRGYSHLADAGTSAAQWDALMPYAELTALVESADDQFA